MLEVSSGPSTVLEIEEPIAASLAALLAEDGEFPGAGTVVDVGGGKGTFTAAILPAHGRLLIVEQLLPDDDRPHYGKDIDIRMLTFSSGKERTDAEYFVLLAEAGFNPGRVAELASGRSLITATPEADLSA